MSDEQLPDSEYATVVPYPGGTIVVRPVSFKQARAFRREIGNLVAGATSGNPLDLMLAGFDDRIVDLAEACCTPRPSDVDGLPANIGARCVAEWVALNARPERWSPIVGLAGADAGESGRPARLTEGDLVAAVVAAGESRADVERCDRPGWPYRGWSLPELSRSFRSRRGRPGHDDESSS